MGVVHVFVRKKKDPMENILEMDERGDTRWVMFHTVVSKTWSWQTSTRGGGCGGAGYMQPVKILNPARWIKNWNKKSYISSIFYKKNF